MTNILREFTLVQLVDGIVCVREEMLKLDVVYGEKYSSRYSDLQKWYRELREELKAREEMMK